MDRIDTDNSTLSFQKILLVVATSAWKIAAMNALPAT
jgi:hypothetical protein